MYKGSSITLMRDIPYFMIFFPLNASLVSLFTPENGRCSLGGLLAAGCFAGMTSAFLSERRVKDMTISDAHGCD